MTSVILPPDSTLYHACQQLVASARIVFFVGLPGVGKSLLSQQLALMADQAGRKIHMLQWDAVRRPFETDAYVLKNYPVVDGVTHSVVRKAIGRWVRGAIGQWDRHYPEQAEMLIGEAPIIGNRLIELLQSHYDDVEPILSASTTRFVIPVPSREVRRTIEGKRDASGSNLQPEQQRDAIPQVLRAAWIELYRAAHELKMTGNPVGPHIYYNPDIYQGVYSMLLKHRHRQQLPLNVHLATDNLSVHTIHIPHGTLAPTMDEVHAYVGQVERLYPDMIALGREMNTWYLV